MIDFYDGEDLQRDMTARLDSWPYFSDVTIAADNPGMIDDEVTKALSTLNEKAGKGGTFILVMMCEELVPDTNAIGPSTRIKIAVRVYTDSLINDTDDGTRKSNAKLRRNVRKALHLWSPNGNNEIYCAEKCGSPIDGPEGVVSYELDFEMVLPESFEFPPHSPRITLAGALPAMSATLDQPFGAEIRYTLDGSFPGPTSALYAGPLTIAEPTQLRAAAYVAGIGSSIAQATIQ